MDSITAFAKVGALLLSILVTLGAHFASAAALRIGYYGGTFDPATLGHRQLAERAIKAGHLDLLYIVPAITNSKKPNAKPYFERKELLRLGFEGVERVLIPDSEMERAYENDRSTGVIRLLLHRYPGARILKVTGDDVISRNFTDHLNSDPLFKDVGFIIGERSGKNQEIAEDKNVFDFGNRELIILPQSEDQGISSSEVRALLLEGNPKARTLLAPAVYNAIRANGLYPIKCDFVLGKAG